MVTKQGTLFINKVNGFIFLIRFMCTLRIITPELSSRTFELFKKSSVRMSLCGNSFSVLR